MDYKYHPKDMYTVLLMEGAAGAVGCVGLIWSL